jgi:serpin B
MTIRYNRHRLVTTLSLVVAGMILLACGMLPGAISGGGEVTVAEARSDAPRDTSPDVSATDLGELVDGNNAFAFAFYRAIRGEEGNIVYSPYSISAALAMTYAGARGETEQQMADALHFTLPQDRLHPAFDAVDLALAGRGETAQGEEDDSQGFQLNIANALWGQQDYPFAPDFLDLLAANYGAGMSLMDFMGAPEDSRLVINEWVAERTEDRIRDLIPQGAIDSSTRLVLTNAIYFYADWLHPFPAEGTFDSPFTLLDGSQVSVPMMNQSEAQLLRYMAGEGYQAVEMPYEGNDIAMLILLPDEGQFEAFDAGLDAAQFASIQNGLSDGSMVLLSMPRFEFETPSISLKDILSDLGMPIAFDTGADFSGMVEMEGNPELYISDVFHKAFIRVDEEGTEAAAATAVVMAEAAMAIGPEPIIVQVDRPFFFAIVDRPTGTILFMGRVVDPR